LKNSNDEKGVCPSNGSAELPEKRQFSAQVHTEIMVFTCGVTADLIGGGLTVGFYARIAGTTAWPEYPYDRNNRMTGPWIPVQARNDNFRMIRIPQFSAQVHTEIAYN
jgi:hypothetical protein